VSSLVAGERRGVDGGAGGCVWRGRHTPNSDRREKRIRLPPVDSR
jgi:hypothetical protein